MGRGTRVPPGHRSIKVGREGGSLPETGQGISKGAEIDIDRAVPKTPFFCLVEVKFPKCRNHHFKANNSVEFRTFTMLCNRHLYLILELFHHPRKKPLSIDSHSHPTLQPLATTGLLCTSVNLPVWTFHVNRVIQSAASVSSVFHLA